ncbi:MAG: hypothetical protein NTY95_14370, partial [Bacteroidia bacterium]|nr:hypothetical protein [Bacteroidia bacterium]
FRPLESVSIFFQKFQTSIITVSYDLPLSAENHGRIDPSSYLFLPDGIELYRSKLLCHLPGYLLQISNDIRKILQ